MRIVQTSDGRYIKILNPQLQGVIGRLYGEITERKAADGNYDSVLNSHQNQMTIITTQMETMLIRYAEITDILRKLFPEDEPIATIDRPLLVDGSVKAGTFISIEGTLPPLTVTSQALVKHLNVEFLNGHSLDNVHTTMDEKINALDVDVTNRIGDVNTYNNTHYAPIEHVNAGGPGVHPYATITVAGFMSPIDKNDHDKMKAQTDLINLPGGMSIGSSTPVAPKVMQVWIDTN